MSSGSDADSYAAYYDELVQVRLGPALRSASVFVIGLNLFFVLLDGAVYADRFSELFCIRLVWSAFMVFTIWLIPRADPLTSARLGCVVTGTALIALSGAAGGISSVYWPALMVLFLGMPVLLPLAAKDAAYLVSFLSSLFACLPLLTGEQVSGPAFAVPVFFVVAAGIECVASAHALDQMRFRDFLRRIEIEQARDELRELDRAKSRFTANIHHELRTPLTLTLAPLESLMGGEFGPVSDRQRDYMKTMHVNALRLLKLINNLLDLAKIESDQLQIWRRPLSVAELIDDIVHGARPLAERKGVVLEGLQVPIDLDLNADRDALEKVLINLVGNALKFTERRGRIEVSARGTERGVHIEVTDTGMGLEPTDMKRIFDRFAQADGSSTRSHEGTGIGLSLSKELVELHGGEIWAESAGAGEGATFHVLLPRGEEDHRDQAQQGRSDAGDLSIEIEATAGSELRMAEIERTAARSDRSIEAVSGTNTDQLERAEVLVCEDNPEMRRLLADILCSEFRVRVVANGMLGLKAVQERLPDLVLSDVMMPEMSGTELCRTLKGDEQTQGLPIVLITSNAEREMKLEGLELGADDYVTKPFHSRELLARVRSLIRVRQLQFQLRERNDVLEQTNADLAQAIRDLKSAEAQLVLSERLAAVGELAAGIAHEANNPVNYAANAAHALRPYVNDLTSVVEDVLKLARRQSGTGPLISKEVLEGINCLEVEASAEAIQELIEIVEDGLHRTGKLIGDLKNFAAPSRGEATEVDLIKTLEGSKQLLRHSLHQHSVSVDLSSPKGLPRVLGDSQALGQVFLNILKNACEALETSGGQIRVKFAAEGAGVSVEIHDDGPGIEGEDMGRLFDPFFTTKAPGRGTGLGLSISRKVVEAHGGRIAVASEPGDGTTFRIWLPAEVPDAA